MSEKKIQIYLEETAKMGLIGFTDFGFCEGFVYILALTFSFPQLFYIAQVMIISCVYCIIGFSVLVNVARENATDNFYRPCGLLYCWIKSNLSAQMWSCINYCVIQWESYLRCIYLASLN